MTMYAVERLKDSDNAEISFVVSNNGSHELVLSSRDKRHIHVWDEAKSSFKNIARLGREITKEKFDEVYLAYPSWKREGVVGLVARSVEKKVVLDSDGDWRFLRKFFKTQIKKTSRIHDINTNYLLFGVPNDGYLRSGGSLVEIVKEHHADYARKFFAQNDLQNRFILAVHPGSKGESKRWDAQKFVRLCTELNKRFDTRFVIIGGDDELLLKQTIARGIGEIAVVLNFAGLYQTASVLSKCNLFIGNDSAPMHLSVVVGTPVVALWGCSDLYRTSPYGPGNMVVRKSSPVDPSYRFNRRRVSGGAHEMRSIRDLQLENVLPVVSRYVEILRDGKRDTSTIDTDLAAIPGLEKIYRLEHGCTVIEFKG